MNSNTKSMGRVKELLMEMEERGFDIYQLEGKYVCSHHFDDVYLNQYITSHSVEGVCSYCGKKVPVIDMVTLADHIGMNIAVYFNDVDSENLPLASSYFEEDDEEIPGIKRVGCYAAPANADVFDDTSEMMDRLGLHTNNDRLNSDIDGMFANYMWIKKDSFKLWWNEEMEYQWKRFSEIVKHSRRFTFLAMPESSECATMLDDLNSVLHSSKDILHIIPKGSKLYRARSLNNDLDDSFGFDKITSAPEVYAGQCRMSPAGVSMFYGSFDKNTAIKECIKTDREKLLVVGEFISLRDFKVIDLTSLPAKISIWMDNWQIFAFLRSFHKDITKPLTKGDKEEIEYVPSQIFTEYLRWMFKDKYNNNVDGLIYESCKTRNANIVLFCNNSESRSWLSLEKFFTDKMP